MRKDVPIHNLQHNAAERSPRHVIIWDTETRWVNDGVTERHSLRVWVARHRHRHSNVHRKGNVVTEHGTDAADLAQTIAAWCAHASSTWLYAHGLGFDLSVSGLLTELGRLGWHLGDNALTLDTPWCRLSDGKHTLTIADSASIFRTGLQQVGDLIGVAKPELPDNDDTEEAWYVRCLGDVDILDAALMEIMDWWDAHKRGCWTLTGPALGWNMYRHQLNGQKIVIDPDEDARKFERSAIYGGRREVWRVGQLPRGRYVEVDFKHAHLSVCESAMLPKKRGRKFTGEPHPAVWRLPDQLGAIADVTVEVDTPRYPARIGGTIFHPVGRFRTTLCWPELLEAQRLGHIRQWHSGYEYRLSNTMESWAVALRGILDDRPEQHPPTAHLAGTAWSKTVPGKWATRRSERVETLPSQHQALTVERGIDFTTLQPATIVHLGGEQQWYVGDYESDNSFPAVLAWIQSATRVALGRMIDAIDPRDMVSCNTDGMIIRGNVRNHARDLAALTKPITPRVKATYEDIEVLSPQHILLDGKPRLSGIPKSAKSTGSAQWEWTTWPKFARQMELNDGAGYTRKRRSVKLHNVPVARWVHRSGITEPPRATVDSDGTTRLISRDEYVWPLSAAPLRESQHHRLPWPPPASQTAQKGTDSGSMELRGRRVSAPARKSSKAASR